MNILQEVWSWSLVLWLQELGGKRSSDCGGDDGVIVILSVRLLCFSLLPQSLLFLKSSVKQVLEKLFRYKALSL